MRRMATYRTIKELQAIPEADNIDVATVDGWKVVVRKGEFRVGDRVIYLEIDSWVPYTVAPFLYKEGTTKKSYKGVEGARLRTAKIKKQVSQGLILHTNVLVEDTPEEQLDNVLNIQKWEPKIDLSLAGKVKGTFPSCIPKTDQERIQNCWDEIKEKHKNHAWEITEKLDGSSMTVFFNGNFGVCSRNLELKETSDNAFWIAAHSNALFYKITEIRKELNIDLALQGELIGPKIQKNKYSKKDLEFHLFDIYDITNQKYLRPEERLELAKRFNIQHVPVYNLSGFLPDTLGDTLEAAEGNSWVADTQREGVVWKCQEDEASFKVISNKWLLGNDG